MRLARLCVLMLMVCLCVPVLAAGPQTPSQFLGFEVGADKKLADYHQITDYFKHLSANSPRVEVEVLGKTTNGNDMIMAIISTEENLKNKKKYQDIAHKLADPRGLTQPQIDALVRDGKAILLVTCNIHSTEIASSQMSMEWAYALATANDPETKARLNDVILLLVPSLNPDGEIMETEWYRKNLGTKFEGGRMPWLYHPYVGHDNNRDWYMLTQKETRNMTHAAYHEWYPQIWLDEHQMGSTGPRLFVPPYTDPISDEVSPLMWRGINVIGDTMAWRLEQHGKSGVVYGYSFDQYWPGAVEGTPQFKNIFGLLTEAASVRLATPLNIAPTELSAGGKGLVDYRRTANFPNPWPGGVWRLRDIMDYERIASDAILETAAAHKADFMSGTAAMALEQIKWGKPDEFWRIPRRQYDSVTAAKLAFLLRDHGADVLVSADGKDFLVPTSQPYGKFLSTMLSSQRYPKVRFAPNTPILRPYDVTAWTLPLLMGVDIGKITVPDHKGMRPLAETDWPDGGLAGSSVVYAISHQQNNVTKLMNTVLKAGGSVSVAKEAFTAGGVNYPVGTVLFAPSANLSALAAADHLKLQGLAEMPKVATAKVKNTRVALYKPWSSSMDEGWTRWLLEQYDFNLKNVDNKTLQAGKLNDSFDVVIFASMDKNMIMEGKPRSEGGPARYFEELPAEYTGGIGKDGLKALKDFVAAGGTIITLGTSGDLLSDEFGIPVRNALGGGARGGSGGGEFNVPGSLLRMNFDTTHPVNYGMPEEAAAFLDEGIAYQTSSPTPDVQRSILAWYPTDEEDILMSGYIQGADRLARRASAVSITQGKGKLVLLGFGVQNRAQTEGTFKVLFNAIHWAGME